MCVLCSEPSSSFSPLSEWKAKVYPRACKSLCFPSFWFISCQSFLPHWCPCLMVNMPSISQFGAFAHAVPTGQIDRLHIADLYMALCMNLRAMFNCHLLRLVLTTPYTIAVLPLCRLSHPTLPFPRPGFSPVLCLSPSSRMCVYLVVYSLSPWVEHKLHRGRDFVLELLYHLCLGRHLPSKINNKLIRINLSTFFSWSFLILHLPPPPSLVQPSAHVSRKWYLVSLWLQMCNLSFHICRKILFIGYWYFFSCSQLHMASRRRQWQPAPVLLPGKSHGRGSLIGYSPWGCQELDTTERLHFHFSLSCIGDAHGNPLQCSWLKNPTDGWALWAAIYGVAQSQPWLKQLSSSSSSSRSLSMCVF